VDVLNLLDVAFKHGDSAVETLFVDMGRWRKRVEMKFIRWRGP
jgi:hypothetical protein